MFRYKDYYTMIVDIRNLFVNEREKWNKLLEEANSMTTKDSCFSDEIHPHFYSGNLFNIHDKSLIPKKYLFITMNPKLRKDMVIQDRNGLKKLQIDDFIVNQNTALANFTGSSQIYKRCQKIVGKLENIDIPATGYSLLNKFAVVIDWFPFYSSSFKLSNEPNQLALDLLFPILNMFQECDMIAVIIGRQIIDSIKKLIPTFKIINLKEHPNVRAISLKKLKYTNIEIYGIKNFKLLVIPILAGKYEPDKRVYEDISDIVKILHQL